MVTARGPAATDGPADPSTEGAEAAGDASFPLLIAVAASLEERVRLAQLVDDVAPLLLVSSLDELRRLIARETPAVPPAEPVPEPAGAERSLDVLTIDSTRSVAQWRGREVTLTGLEHDLLARLNTEPLRVWTYEALHQAVWRNRHLRGAGDVHSLVKRLRRKLAGLGTTVTIDAVRGTGFRLTDHQRPAINNLRAG